MKSNRFYRFIIFVLTISATIPVLAQGTTFTYHGRLASNGSPASGSYDLIFSMFDADTGTNQVGDTITNTALHVADGLFTASLDFGIGIFTGPERWLEIGVRTNGTGDFTTLSPRRLLTPTPYAIMANTASNLLGTLSASQLTGTAAIDTSGNAATATSATTAATAGSAGTFTSPLAGDVSGTQAATVVTSIGGQTAANVASGVTAANAATTANSPDTIVRRDSNGNFAAGAITSASVSGDGSGLTALNASQISSGTLLDARLSSNVGLLDANQTFSGSNRFSGVVQLTNTASTIAGTFSGSGSNLTGLNPTNLSPGTAAINISGNAATATTAASAGTATTATTAITATTAATAGSAATASNFSGLLSGDVTGLQGATVVAGVGGQSAAQIASGASAANAATPASIPNSLVRRDNAGNFAAGAITAASVSGDGSGLTALDASQLASGSVADARLSSNVALRDAHQTFSGSNDFAGVLNATNTDNSFVGTFSGDGAGLSNLVVGAANLSGGLPASLLTGTLPSSLLTGSYTNPVTFSNPANNFAGNGAWLSNVNATALGGVRAANFWQLGGNAGTIDGVDFLGTTDDQPLELRVNNSRAFRLEPNANAAPNIIGGAPANYVAEGVIGATISGGGTADAMQSNSISSDYAMIGGGSGNTIQTLDIASSEFAVIDGGQDNSINGALRSAIGGGASNLILSPQRESYPWTNINSDSTISGGWSNSIEAPFSTIGGGIQNLITIGTGRDVIRTTNGTIAGGFSNVICGSHSTISGGRFNTIRVTGGLPPEYHGNGDCTIGGGSFNRLKDSGLEPLTGATISGGSGNLIAENSDYSFIGGGLTNWIYYNSRNSVIAGGSENTIRSFSSSSSIGGGWSNTIVGIYSTINGGNQNRIYAAWHATIPGGENNAVEGDYGFAAGRRAKAYHDGAFVWADSTDADFASMETNTFSVRSTGGARFVSATDPAGIPVAGVELLAGGGSWSSLSDRNAKENFTAINPLEILERVKGMPITTWNYKSQDSTIRHIGPMAQDFAAAFQVGENDLRITTVDADGVALAAIQGLNQKLEEKDAEIQSLRKRLEVLERAVLGREVAQDGGGQ